MITLFAIFVISLLFSPRRSIVTRAINRARVRARVKHELAQEGATA
ncbi:MAG: hypothetical protein R2722_13620 [Tessaracoccus sp.]